MCDRCIVLKRDTDVVEMWGAAKLENRLPSLVRTLRYEIMVDFLQGLPFQAAPVSFVVL